MYSTVLLDTVLCCIQSWMPSAINQRRWSVYWWQHLAALPSPSVVNSTVMTIAYLLQSATVDVWWQNFSEFRVAEFREKFRGMYPYFWKYHNLLKTQCRISQGEPACPKPAQFLQPLWYYPGLQQKDTQTDGFRSTAIYRDIAYRSVTYTVSQKKVAHCTLVHIFAKYWPIFIILSPMYSVGNLQ